MKNKALNTIAAIVVCAWLVFVLVCAVYYFSSP